MAFGLELLESDAPELLEAVEVFQTSCGRGLRAAKDFEPGEVVLADKALLPPCANADEFATAASSQWESFSPKDRCKLMSLRWRSSTPEVDDGVTALIDWQGFSKVPGAPNLPRLRGIASFNGMAVVKLMMKPSSLKTLEAVPRNGLAVYLNGSMLNHSCSPTANRLPFQKSLVVRAQRQLLPGEELTCAYIEIRAPHFIRQAELETTWAFECCCWRCRLEQNLWQAAPDAERGLRAAWRRFERLRKSGTCEEEELRELVSSIADFTKTSLLEFLTQKRPDGLPDDLREERALQRYQDAWRCSGEDVKTLDPLSLSKTGTTLVALFRLLLGSFWVAPAFELAFGLQESQRHSEALTYWLAVRDVTAELMPLSPSHSAAATEAALAAVAAAVPWEETLEEGVRVCYGTYGANSWIRLAAGRLEHFEDSMRRKLEGFVGRCEDLLAGRPVQAPISPLASQGQSCLDGLD